MNYLQVRQQFQSLLNRRDCTDTQAQAFVQAALQRIQRELRVPAMETSALAVIDGTLITNGGLAIPADLLELINLIPLTTLGGLQQTDMKRLERCDISRALIGALVLGIPRQYSRRGGVWVIAPAPASGDTIRIDYYAEFAPLVADVDSNIVTLIAPDLLYYCALSYAGDFFTDSRSQAWESRYGQILIDLQEMGDSDDQHGASVVQPAFNYPDDLQGGWDVWPVSSS